MDCTDDNAKNLCNKYGVQGYPTLKYFTPTGPELGDSYEDGRELKELKKFVMRKSKKPCDPETQENCDKKDKAYIEEIKDMDPAKLKELRDSIAKDLNDLSVEQKAASELFEKQKDEAMATNKKAEDAKAAMNKLNNKVGYKLLILKALSEAKHQEL